MVTVVVYGLYCGQAEYRISSNGSRISIQARV